MKLAKQSIRFLVSLLLALTVFSDNLSAQTIKVDSSFYPMYQTAIDSILNGKNFKYAVNFKAYNSNVQLFRDDMISQLGMSDLDADFLISNISTKYTQEGLKFDKDFQKRFRPANIGLDVVICFSEVAVGQGSYAEYVLSADVSMAADRDQIRHYLFFFNKDKSLKSFLVRLTSM